MKQSWTRAVFALSLSCLLTGPAAGAPDGGTKVAATVPGNWQVALYDTSSTETVVGRVPAEDFPTQVTALKRKNGAIAIELSGFEDDWVWVLPMDVEIDLPPRADVICDTTGRGEGGTTLRGVSEVCND